MPWIYNEDASLKLKLQGIQVFDANAPQGRNVPVRFRLPEDELATLSYPIIIIEHDGIYPDPSREHRCGVPNGALYQLPYAPDGFAPWWPSDAVTIDPSQSPYFSYSFPLPYNMDYVVTVYSRKMPEHLQPIMATLAKESYLPYHMGYLNVLADNTVRSMFLLGGPQVEYGKDGDNKRLLRAIYKVRVVTEVIPEVLTFTSRVNTIFLDLGCYRNVKDLTTEEVATNVAVISTGPNVSFNVGQQQVTTTGASRPAQRIPRKKPSRAVTKAN